MATPVSESSEIVNHAHEASAKASFLSGMIREIKHEIAGLTYKQQIQAKDFLVELEKDWILKKSEADMAREAFQNDRIEALERDIEAFENHSRLLNRVVDEQMHSVCRKRFEGNVSMAAAMQNEALEAYLHKDRIVHAIYAFQEERYALKQRKALQGYMALVNEEFAPRYEALGGNRRFNEAYVRLDTEAYIEACRRKALDEMERSLCKLRKQKEACELYGSWNVTYLRETHREALAPCLEQILRKPHRDAFSPCLEPLQDLAGRIGRIKALEQRLHNGRTLRQGLDWYLFQYIMTSYLYCAYKSLTTASLGIVSQKLRQTYQDKTNHWNAKEIAAFIIWKKAREASAGSGSEE